MVCWSWRFCSCSMRISAIICWCSLLAAAAGTAVAATRAALATNVRTRMADLGLLGGNDEVGAAVVRPRRLAVARVERELLAIADRPQPLGGDAEGDEVLADRQRPPLAQRQVVLGGAALVAVALDRDHPGRVLLHRL